MTIDLNVLEMFALDANQAGGDPWYVADDLLTQSYGQLLPQDRRFIAAASPETVLSLIRERNALRAALKAMVLNDTHAYRDCHKAAVAALKECLA